jgi:hypothetical protein
MSTIGAYGPYSLFCSVFDFIFLIVGEGGRKHVIVGQLHVSEAYGAAQWPAGVWALVRWPEGNTALYGADAHYELPSTIGFRPGVRCRREVTASCR